MLRNVHLWLPGYFAGRKRGALPCPVHVIFCFVDHYEPLWGKPAREVALARVGHWRERYPQLCAQFRDVDGRPPQHSWFYPAEEYAPEYLEPLAELTELGLGEVEIHLHHRHDTAANLRDTLEDFKRKLRSHGLLAEQKDRGRQTADGRRTAEQAGSRKPEAGSAKSGEASAQEISCVPQNEVSSHGGDRRGTRAGLASTSPDVSRLPLTSSRASGASVQYGFIHGNWALDNSRGDGDWCGVNNELQVLRETGCYADFTLPSAPSDTQTRKVNAIYYATDDPDKPKSHDSGADVRVRSDGRPQTADGSGRERAGSRKPEAGSEGRAEVVRGKGEITGDPGVAAAASPFPLAPCPLPSAGDLLLIQGPLALNWRRRKWGVLPRIEAGNVAGHCRPSTARVDLWVQQRIGVVGRPDWIFVKVHTHGCQEGNFDAVLDGTLHRALARYNDGQQYHLHYVTAREMYNLVKAAEAGASGDPNPYRDFVLGPPPRRQR